MTTRRVLVEAKSLVIGGTEVNAVQFAAAVREHGYESVLIAPADSLPLGPSLHEVAAAYGVELRTYDRSPSVLGGARMLSRLADDLDADLVHIYSQRRMRAAYLGPCRLGRRALVVTAYEMEVSPFTLRGVPLVVGTRYLEEELAERPAATKLISPPVDVDSDRSSAVDGAVFRAEHGVRDDETLVVWVGRLAGDMKAAAVRDIIASAELLDRDGAVFLLVGTGDAEAALRAAASRVNERLGRAAVRFAGGLADPRPAYAAADVGIAMGGSAARTLSFGRPLVAIGERGWSKRFDAESAEGVFRNSFWSDVEFPDGGRRLAGELRPLLADARLRRQLGEFGREFAVRRFGLPAMGACLAAVYDDALRDYGLRKWTLDLDLERAAAAHLITRHFVPSGDAGAEYRFSEKATSRLRGRVPLVPRGMDASLRDREDWLRMSVSA